MTAPVTPVEVANLTLDVIKTENVENIEDVSGDEIAAVINRWWDVSRRKCLEGFPWYFASARKSIQLVSPAPDFGYTDQYRLPNGFVGLNFITDESLPLSKWDYTIEGDYLLINNSGAASLNIGYVKDTTNVSNWTSSFLLYVAYQLAYYVVFKLTGQNQTTTRIQNQLAPHRNEAKAINGLTVPPKAYRESAMIAGRQRYRG